MTGRDDSARHLAEQLGKASQELDRLQRLLDDAIGSLMSGFSRVAELTGSQRELLHALLAERAESESSGTAPATSSSRARAVGEEYRRRSDRNADELAVALNGALTSLQFEDISTQLINHVRERVADLSEILLDPETRLAAAGLGADRPMNARTFGPVSQEGLDRGSVELF